MACNAGEKFQVININDDCSEKIESVLSNDKTLPARSSSAHCHVPDNKLDNGARNRLIVVLILCIIFMIIEVIGGILSNSTAVLTDAAHLGIDVGSFLISLTAIYLGRKRPTQKLSFGYIRAEVLGALLSVLLLWLGTGILVYMAIQRCIDRRFEVQPTEMIVVASCGVIFNIIMFFVLHFNMNDQSSSHHGHSHGSKYDHLDDRNYIHSHVDKQVINKDESFVIEIVSGQNQGVEPKQAKNINIRAAIIHVIGDFVQSVGVLFAAILIKIKPEYKLADPICTFAFSVLVLITTTTIMRDIVFVLMEGVPSSVSYTRIVDDLLRIPGVRNTHSLHIWSLSLQKIALSVHIAIDRDRDCLTVINDAQEMLRREHSITEATIQIELYDEQIMNSCENCRQPGT